MTEEEARGWAQRRLTEPQFAKLETFVSMVVEENARQNLISSATIPVIWLRHVVDSLQLIDLAGGTGGRWLDVGTGGGFPGMVLAIAGCAPMLMVEPRRKRADFLAVTVAKLALENVQIAVSKVEHVEWQATVITARAVASIEKLLLAAEHCATKATRWLLPRGTVDTATISSLSARHQMVFHVEQSLTHPDSVILVLDGRAR